MTKEKTTQFNSDPKSKQDLLSENASLKRELAAHKQQLQANNDDARFNELVENVPDALILHDPTGKIVLVNEALCRSLGYTRKQLLRMNVRDFEVGRPSADLHRIWHDMHETESLMGRHRRCDGSEFPVEVRVSQFGTDKAPLFLALARDMTERAAIERSLVLARDSAELANQAKSEFLANMSHELRTPLNSIIGFSEVMQFKVFGAVTEPKYVEYIDDIKRSGVHLLSVIDDILDMAKIEAHQIDLQEEPIDVRSVIRDCKRMISQRAEQGGIKLTSRVDAKISHVLADKRRLIQILINLLTNAVKFTPEHGRMKLLCQLSENRSIQFIVEDTGVGISADEIANVFEPFTQAREHPTQTHEGTGLGLSLVRELARLHGGSVTLTSKLNKGTRVTVTLPARRLVS